LFNDDKLYICIFSNKFDLNQATSVFSYNNNTRMMFIFVMIYKKYRVNQNSEKIFMNHKTIIDVLSMKFVKLFGFLVEFDRKCLLCSFLWECIKFIPVFLPTKQAYLIDDYGSFYVSKYLWVQ
jgi:hypothetical protein